MVKLISLSEYIWIYKNSLSKSFPKLSQHGVLTERKQWVRKFRFRYGGRWGTMGGSARLLWGKAI